MSRGLLMIVTMALLAGCRSASQEPTLDEVRAVAERYRDVKVAIAEGYTTDNKCVTAEMLGHPASLGVMGLHYVRRDVLGLPRQARRAGQGHRHAHGFPHARDAGLRAAARRFA